MLLFTQVGVTSSSVEQAALVQSALAPAVTVASADAGPSVSVLPKPVKPDVSTDQAKATADSGDDSSESVQEIVENFFGKNSVLTRIARCESSFRQFDSSGNILRGKVNKKDIGVMQINEQFHAAKARSLGIDLYTLQGNLKYAALLYKEQGTAPWNSSEGCWGGALATNISVN